ncbi:hypothetical protein K501DRAFT_177704 [Backusella circina FSU 941]|nr:hypothetical protein K501DRAFT_177704 [Backusella circina FSU 941]
MSLINIRRLYSTGLTDWTKTSLRRLKKSELLKIAKENQLKVTGTKNDIIDELLGYQDARQTSPPLQRQLNDETTAKHIPEETPLENDMSEDWVKAFDMKVAQRGSSFKRPFDPKRPAPIFRPDVEKKKRVEPVISIGEIREVVVSEPAPVQEVEEIDGMDGLWVEAFDRKVGTRGARHQLADTLSPEPKLSGLALEFVSFDTKKEEKKDERTHHIETVIKSEPFTAKQDSGHQQQNQSNVVSGLVGTSMLVWYFGGGETFQKIWDFFGSS